MPVSPKLSLSGRSSSLFADVISPPPHVIGSPLPEGQDEHGLPCFVAIRGKKVKCVTCSSGPCSFAPIAGKSSDDKESIDRIIGRISAVADMVQDPGHKAQLESVIESLKKH